MIIASISVKDEDGNELIHQSRPNLGEWMTPSRCQITQGTYIGHHVELKGKKALLQIEGSSIRAQFDDRSLAQAYGWSIFERGDFIVERSITPVVHDERSPLGVTDPRP